MRPHQALARLSFLLGYSLLDIGNFAFSEGEECPITNKEYPISKAGFAGASSPSIGMASPLRSGCLPGQTIYLPIVPRSASRWFCSSRPTYPESGRFTTKSRPRRKDGVRAISDSRGGWIRETARNLNTEMESRAGAQGRRGEDRQ